ncbi:hypothetical protein Tco_0940097 [Tanacetum coccineum]|uniref:Uncharacterized protein n=1 Tax=Tanacetum coccineum TaxID=301880 RepID=A0ABQ5DPC7_9ASTR
MLSLGKRQPAWTNTIRVNKEITSLPRTCTTSNIRPNLSTANKTIKTGRVNVNTGHGNVSTVSSAGTHIKSGSSRFNTGKQNVNSGTAVEDLTGRVTFKSSKMTTLVLAVSEGKATQGLPVEAKIDKICAPPITHLATEEAADLMVVSSTSLTEATRKAVVSEKIATKKTHSPKQPSSTPISKSADDIMTFRKELDALALKHLGPVPAKAPTSTNPVNTGSINLNTTFEKVNPGNI